MREVIQRQKKFSNDRRFSFFFFFFFLDENEKMIPNLNMSYYQREDLVKPCHIQTGVKIAKKSVEGFEYSSLFASKTYSILSYVVGGFVGSKSQMNNNKHNLSYDLSAAIINLLNPCKYEREKGFRKCGEHFYSPTPKIGPEGYDKYIVKSSHKRKMIDLGMELWESYMLGFDDPCYPSDPPAESFDCDERKSSSENQTHGDSIDVTDRVSTCEVRSPEKCLKTSVLSERFRQQSECSVESTDSESFIIFDNPDQEDEKRSEDSWKLEDFDFDSDDGKDDDSCDDFDICAVDKELADANDKWKKNYASVETPGGEGQRKVRFNDDVKINKIVAWDYAYRAARLGPWEQMARDRVRFRERILRLSATISPILGKEHRDKIYKKLYS